MDAQPEVRESGWLYGDDPLVPLALVRLEEQPRGVGWVVLLNDPASAPTQRAEHPDEGSARAKLERIYEQGRVHGRWTIHRREQG